MLHSARILLHASNMWSRRTFLGGCLCCAACAKTNVGPMSYSEYSESEHSIPYVLLYVASRGALLYFGSGHFSDPQHEQAEQIISHWARFGPTLALNEGGSPPTEQTIDEAVSRHGESGLVRFLAARDNVFVDTLEPPYVNQVDDLKAQGFSAEQLKVFFVLRQIPQLRHRDPKPMSSIRVRSLLDYFSRIDGLQEGPKTLEEFESSCRRLLPPMPYWPLVPEAWFDPIYDKPTTFLNRASRATSIYRDQWVVDLLVGRVRAGERVFAVMGASHVAIQENALTTRVGRPCHLRPTAQRELETSRCRDSGFGPRPYNSYRVRARTTRGRTPR